MDKYTNHKIRYVDIKKVTIPRGFFNQDLNVPKLFDWLYSQPEVDVVEVRHGYWRLETDEEMPNPMFKLVECSVCKEKTGHTFDYCPHCGAKMDLKEGTE